MQGLPREIRRLFGPKQKQEGITRDASSVAQSKLRQERFSFTAAPDGQFVSRREQAKPAKKADPDGALLSVDDCTLSAVTLRLCSWRYAIHVEPLNIGSQAFGPLRESYVPYLMQRR